MQTGVALDELMEPFKKDSYDNILVLSLGTGSKDTEAEDKYDVRTSSKWGALQWILFNNSPLTKIFSQASEDLVDYRIRDVFKPENYLRIQVRA